MPRSQVCFDRPLFTVARCLPTLEWSERFRQGRKSARSTVGVTENSRSSLVNPLKTMAVAAFLAATTFAAAAVEISGAGATFPYPVYAKWADVYKKATGIGLNYQSIGSGGGIKQVEAKTVTFGATDAPLKGPELDKFG